MVAVTAADVRARIIRAVEAIQDGDVSLAYQILLDLELDLERAAA